MTVDQKSTLLRAFQSKTALSGAGVVLVEGPSAETLREPKAVLPRIYVILQQLDQLRSFWYEPTMTNDLALQVPKVGFPINRPSYACLMYGTHAVFVGALTTSRTVVTTALAQAASALKDVSHDLKMDALTLQAQMQRENLVFTSVSNVLKTRHDTAKNSINNVR